MQNLKELIRSPLKPDEEAGRPVGIRPRTLPVRSLDGDSGRIILLPVDEIAYFFRGSAVRQGLILTTWDSRLKFQPQAIYVRTTKGAWYKTFHRSFKTLTGPLDERFLSIHQSLLLNLHALREVYLRSKMPLAGVRVGGQAEYIVISRRRLGALRRGILP